MTSEWIEVSAGPARHPALSLPETRPEDVRSRRTSDLIEVSLFAVTVVLTGLLAEAASLKSCRPR
jgi:hypothetical protein